MYSSPDDHQYQRDTLQPAGAPSDSDTVTESVPPLQSAPFIYDTPTLPPFQHIPPNPSSQAAQPWWRRRRHLIVLTSVVLIFLLSGAGIFAAFLLHGSNPSPSASNAKDTPTPIAGPRMFQLALDKDALTSIFVQQLSPQQGALSDLTVTPSPNDGLTMSLNLHIDFNDFHRILPIELDGSIGLDHQQNLQYTIQHVKRDGLDAGPTVAANLQTAFNQMLATSIMPTLHNQLKSAKLISVQTSSSIACGKGAELFILQIEAPPIQGIAAQPTPVPFCIHGQTDLNKLLPQ